MAVLREWRRPSLVRPKDVPPPDEPRTHPWIWLVRGGLVLLSIPWLWLLAINVAWWTGLVEAVVSGDHQRATVRLEHGFAWCVWPTHVHVDELHLEIDAEGWQLDLRVPQGEVDLELHELLSQRVETRWIRGEGAVLAVSLKQPHGTDPTELEGFHPTDRLPAPLRAA